MEKTTRLRHPAAAHPSLFIAHDGLKATYRVEAYWVHLGIRPERLTEQIAYWYSVWSHRRNRLWKGFVQVDLAATEDEAAAATLASITSPGGAP
jgi:hypothetical protein